jgi:hypothetical protein
MENESKSTDLFSGDGPTVGEILSGKKKFSDTMTFFDTVDRYAREMKHVFATLEEARVACNLPPLTVEHVIAIGDKANQLQFAHEIQAGLFIFLDEVQPGIDEVFFTREIVRVMNDVDRKNGYDKDATDIIEIEGE